MIATEIEFNVSLEMLNFFLSNPLSRTQQKHYILCVSLFFLSRFAQKTLIISERPTDLIFIVSFRLIYQHR